MADPDPARADTVFEVLSHRRRRSVLRVLRRYGTPITLADLADEVAVLEHGRPLDAVDAEDVKRIYMSLYHTHVPKLSDADIVVYEQERDMVTLDGSLDEWDELLDSVERLAADDTECEP